MMSEKPNRYDDFYPDRHPDLEMLEASKLTVTCRGRNWIERTDQANGRRFVRGHGGGTIIFDPHGDVRVWWDRNAAIAASHSTGNRKAKAVRDGEKGQAPQRTELFKLVGACRRYFSNDGSTCPERTEDAKTFARAFSDLSWLMLRAVGNGDFDRLRQIADTLQLYESIHSGSVQTPTAKYEILRKAIVNSSKLKDGIPERQEVEKAWRALVSENVNQKASIRHDLEQMGFGWLPAPSRRPRKG